MGHDTHFLDRAAGRLDADELALATRLYQDPELLSFVFANLKVPENADQCAISLGGARDGPFLVVARSGHFVTCLGRGMAPHEAPVVTRREMEDVLADHAGWRERWDLVKRDVADARAADPTASVDVLKPLYDAGPLVGRETFRRAAAAQPFKMWELAGAIMKSASALVDAYALVRRSLRQPDPHERDRPALDRVWHLHWGMAHTVAALMAQRHLRINEAGDFAQVSWSCSPMGIPLAGARVAWALGRQAEDSLAQLSRAFRQVKGHQDYLGCLFGLIQVGLRHRHLRDDAFSLLLQTEGFDGQHPELRKLHQHATIRQGLDRILTDPVGCFERMRDAGRAQALVLVAGARTPPFATPEDVPEGIALAVEATRSGDYFTVDADALAMFDRMPWLAVAEPEDICPPEDFALRFGPKFTPEAAMVLVRRFWHYFRPTQPDVSTRVGRNDPCPCGSEKKYKKCCGATAVEPVPGSDG